MDQVVADRMSPVLAWVFGGICLVKQMPSPLPEANAIGVVDCVFWIYVVVDGSVRVAFIPFSHFVHPLQ